MQQKKLDVKQIFVLILNNNVVLKIKINLLCSFIR